MMSYPLPTAIAALMAFSAISCARSSAPEQSDHELALTSSVAAVAPASAPVADDEDEVEKTGSLVIREDVMKRCPSMKRFQPRDEDSAVDAIRAVGDCMTRGGLRSVRIVVTGGGKATRLFNEALSRFGVPDARVERIVNDAEEADCRVEVGLTKHPVPGPHEDLVLPVRKSQVVGFLVAGALDD